MADDRINGWTAPRLDKLNDTVGDLSQSVTDLRTDVGELKDDFNEFRQEENKRLRARVTELEARPRAWLFGFGVPIMVAVLVAALSHVHL